MLLLALLGFDCPSGKRFLGVRLLPVQNALVLGNLVGDLEHDSVGIFEVNRAYEIMIEWPNALNICFLKAAHPLLHLTLRRDFHAQMKIERGQSIEPVSMILVRYIIEGQIVTARHSKKQMERIDRLAGRINRSWKCPGQF
ncbi:hypothetical protein sphantq_04489 (plasmid) [Sphingobium sp. AntQ-1]|nr:hypothetical protein sphantq_04489 [Sphingobium sp. AntQ-1]